MYALSPKDAGYSSSIRSHSLPWCVIDGTHEQGCDTKLRGLAFEVDEKTYEYTFKCKHCGNEWTEFKTKEKQVKE